MKKTLIFIAFLICFAISINAYTFNTGIIFNNTTNFANVSAVSGSRAIGNGFGSGILASFPITDNIESGIQISYTGYNYTFSDRIMSQTIDYQLHISNLSTKLFGIYNLGLYKNVYPEILFGLMINYGVDGKYFSRIRNSRTLTITDLNDIDLNTDILIDVGLNLKYKLYIYDKIVYITPGIDLIYNLTGSGSQIGYINLNYSPNLTILLSIKTTMPISFIYK